MSNETEADRLVQSASGSESDSFHSAAEDESSSPLPEPSTHSYLPASHPLHTTSDIPRATSLAMASSPIPQNKTNFLHNHVDDPFELIILELPGVVLFPGMTLPLRLEEPSDFRSSSSFWMLRRQIQQSRRAPGQSAAVQIGILTKLDPSTDENGNANNNNGHDTAGDISRRRGSWMRRRIGPERLRRFSEQLIQELGNIQELLDAEIDSEEEEDSDEEQVSNSEPSTARRWTLDGAFNRQSRPPRPSSPESQEEVAFLHRRRGRRVSGSDMVESSYESVDDEDPYAHRIGTLATVTFTHGNNEDVVGTGAEYAGDPNRPRERLSLVLTAVGTGRFRILPNETPGTSNQQSNNESSSLGRYQHLITRTVQEWANERLPKMPQSSYSRYSAIPALVGGPRGSKKRGLSNLASVSVWDEHIYHNNWPWDLMEKLKERMAATSSLNEMLTNAQLHNKLPHRPLEFSYWLAIHLPLSERERLQILFYPTVTERLKWFLEHSLFEATGSSQNTSSQILCCKSCQIPIASGSDLFTLGGAEGTVGNYVNPHGVVHATMTTRSVDTDEIILEGRPEVRDSWFPGYAWTIMYCNLCHSHLGWKFTLAVPNERTSNSTDRPDFFFGLSSSCVDLVNKTLRRSSASQPLRGGRRTRRRGER